MMRNFSFGKRLAAGFGVAGFTLLLVVTVSYRNTYRLTKNNEWVSHTHIVRTELAELATDLVNAETGQRGYIITGDDSYLEPYRMAQKAIPDLLSDLQKLTTDSSMQQQRLASLVPLIEAKMAELKRTIDLRSAQGFEVAQKIVLNNHGKFLMDQIRVILTDADRRESALLEKRAQEAAASARLAIRIVLWGGALGMSVVGLIGWLVTQSLSRQIGGAAGQVQSSSAELQAVSNQQVTSAKEQATAMNEIATTISELLVTSRQIAESAQRVALIADQTAAAAVQGHGIVDQTKESISGIRRQVDQIVTHMLELGRKSQEIGTVLDIVAELAEQTNILAINASIEAAGAGESGRRFAVVADEIRKLADRVAGSTKEIRSLIDEVRSAVNTTVMATETGSKAVDSGTGLFDNVATAFKKISSLVATTTDAAREIELSTKQQTTAVEQVNIAAANVVQVSKETETSASQTLTTVGQLASLSTDLMRIIRSKKANRKAYHAL